MNYSRTAQARKQRQERRRQLLESARHVFAEKGYHSASVSDIITEASVARGTFYLYFTSKRAVFDELLDSIIEDMAAGIERIDVSPGAPPPMRQLKDNVVWILSQLNSKPELLRILLWEAVGLDEELDGKLAAFHQKMFDLTRRSLETGIAMGLVRRCDTRVVSRCVVGSLREVMLSLLVRKDLQSLDLEDLAQELIDFSCRGLLCAQTSGL